MTSQRQATLTRVYRFTAAHYYYKPQLSERENEELFGKCANRNGHGHNYKLEVTLRGPLREDTGMVYDLARLDRTVEREILDVLDYRNLNLDVPWFADHMPTTENIALFVWERLAPQLHPNVLSRVRVYESDDLHAEYDGG